MSFMLGLAQCTHPIDGDVAALADLWMREAQRCGVDLLVFPEGFMAPYDEERSCYAVAPEPTDGPFARSIDTLASRYNLWVVYTLNEASPDGNLPYNTAIVTGPDGVQRGCYRKVHLFDAQGYRESERLLAGDALFTPLKTPFCTLGLAICYDLRFPEVARAAALGGCEVMLYPAAWVSGPGKVKQWETLLSARAIENGMVVAGVSRADAGYVGSSRIFAPDGALLASGARTPWADMPKDLLDNAKSTTTADPNAVAESEALIMARIDLERIATVRAATPSLEHRRPCVY